MVDTLSTGKYRLRVGRGGERLGRSGWPGWPAGSGRNGGRRVAVPRHSPWRPIIPDGPCVQRACRGIRLTLGQVGIWGRKARKSVPGAMVVLIAMHLAGCTLLPPVGAGAFGGEGAGVGKGIVARRAETARPSARVRALPTSPVGGGIADSPEGEFDSVLIDVVEGSVEWVISKVLSDIGDEFLFVHKAQVRDEAPEDVEETDSGGGDEGQEGSPLTLPTATVGAPAVDVDKGPGTVTAQVSLSGIDEARDWLRQMMRVTGYRWYHSGGRWWISRGYLGGNWIWIGERAGWEIARERDLDCVRGWCRAMGEDAELIQLLAGPAGEVRSVSAVAAEVLEEMSDIVQVAQVAGGMVAWGPAWAFDWIDRVKGVGECIGFTLEVPVPASYLEQVASWREQCAVEEHATGAELWLPRRVDAAKVLEVLGARGSWVLAARVWSADVDGEIAFSGTVNAKAGASEAEGVYLARIPWGRGGAQMAESTQWQVAGASVTVDSGAVVSENETQSVQTGVTWEGQALPGGIRGLVTWTEGARETGQVRTLECSGEVDAVPGSGWMTVCAVTGRNARGSLGLALAEFSFGLGGRDRRYLVEVRAWREGVDRRGDRYGALVGLVRRAAKVGREAYADYRDRWETGGWQVLFGVQENP